MPHCSTPTPKRIHPVRAEFFFARNAPVGLVIVRRTYKWVRLVRWNLETDQFEPGQWFHGDVYADHTSLSPNGELFHYLADRYNSPLAPWDPARAWTALSRPPYFTALAFWHNSGVGGGGFLGNEVLFMHSEGGSTKATKGGVPPWLKIVTDDRARAAHQVILLRGADQTPGWQLEAEGTGNSKRPTFRGTLEQTATGIAHSFLDVELLDRDRSGRVITSQRGCLNAWRYTPDGIEFKQLADFNSTMPEPIAPPDWATRWPGSSRELRTSAR